MSRVFFRTKIPIPILPLVAVAGAVALASAADARGGFGGGRMGGMHMGGGHMGGRGHDFAGGGFRGRWFASAPVATSGPAPGTWTLSRPLSSRARTSLRPPGPRPGPGLHPDHHHHHPPPAPYWPGYWDDDDFLWGATAALAIGTMVSRAPSGCRDVQVGTHLYKHCGDTWLQAAYSGHKLVYIAVDDPR